MKRLLVSFLILLFLGCIAPTNSITPLSPAPNPAPETPTNITVGGNDLGPMETNILIEMVVSGSPQYRNVAYADGRVIVDSYDDRLDRSKTLSAQDLARVQAFVTNKEYTLWQNKPLPTSNGNLIVDSYASYFVNENGKRIQIEGNTEIRDILSIPYP